MNIPQIGCVHGLMLEKVLCVCVCVLYVFYITFFCSDPGGTYELPALDIFLRRALPCRQPHCALHGHLLTG